MHRCNDLTFPTQNVSLHLRAAPTAAVQDARFDESLMHDAATTGPAACVWEGAQGLVVPRTYLRAASFNAVRTRFATQGWPISVRHSGGGVVPQGPGILNISIARAMQGRPLDHSDSVYLHLCERIQHALSGFGIRAHTQAVHHSFCDGRFNLATGEGQHAQKIAGTAQLWRRYPTPEGAYAQVVLVHALLLVATDIHRVTEQANALECALGQARRYLPERAVSMHELTPVARDDTATFVQEVTQALRDAIHHG